MKCTGYAGFFIAQVHINTLVGKMIGTYLDIKSIFIGTKILKRKPIILGLTFYRINKLEEVIE